MTTYLKYRDYNFRADKLETIRMADAILNEYAAQGLNMTLRQLYYQFVARGLIENSDASYEKLGTAVSEGRMAGLISWTQIEDANRELHGLSTYRDPKQLLGQLKAGYRIDLWKEQRMRPEVWVEKAALLGVIGPVCNELRVNYFGCRGYNSQTEQWNAGQRFARYIQKGQTPIVFHLGDHDPSGIDMTRDNRERLSLFAGVNVTLVRLALNMDQIEQYNPPPNPAKTTDSRGTGYIAKYGEHSWELDALRPDVIADLIRKAVLQVRDEALWNEAMAQEASDLDDIDMMMESIG